ncbi:hypothetical protein BA190_00235 [Labrys sp. WJW]|uniref:hypothetical protein n=1 Tax=Labrys sp. WJW TaxID=1737983 RepID=UPI0008297D1F|nr:hypothetical protein [Labrys sp. WJW]OCC06703.1 hypothetical protein BA190_00235 [Labrys sp. WJW]
MTRRLDAIRLDAPNLGSSSQETNVKGLQGPPVNRRRLHSIDSRSEEAGKAGRSERSETAARSTGRAAGLSAKRSLDDELQDFVMPKGAGSAILRRSVPILRYCITDLVPQLEGGDQLRSLAQSLMEEEIERHRDLMARLQKETES